jgi:hypothetical protein
MASSLNQEDSEDDWVMFPSPQVVELSLNDGVTDNEATASSSQYRKKDKGKEKETEIEDDRERPSSSQIGQLINIERYLLKKIGWNVVFKLQKNKEITINGIVYRPGDDFDQQTPSWKRRLACAAVSFLGLHTTTDNPVTLVEAVIEPKQGRVRMTYHYQLAWAAGYDKDNYFTIVAVLTQEDQDKLRAQQQDQQEANKSSASQHQLTSSQQVDPQPIEGETDDSNLQQLFMAIDEQSKTFHALLWDAYKVHNHIDLKEYASLATKVARFRDEFRQTVAKLYASGQLDDTYLKKEKNRLTKNFFEALQYARDKTKACREKQEAFGHSIENETSTETHLSQDRVDQ